jgi:hypothetical protein
VSRRDAPPRLQHHQSVSLEARRLESCPSSQRSAPSTAEGDDQARCCPACFMLSPMPRFFCMCTLGEIEDFYDLPQHFKLYLGPFPACPPLSRPSRRRILHTVPRAWGRGTHWPTLFGSSRPASPFLKSARSKSKSPWKPRVCEPRAQIFPTALWAVAPKRLTGKRCEIPLRPRDFTY